MSAVNVCKRGVLRNEALRRVPPATRKLYAVRVGRVPGIYQNWEDCERQVTGYTGNEYKSFATRIEAEKYIGFGNLLTSGADDHKSFILPLESSTLCQPLQPNALYQLEFDGASKGNPGKAGAGALLRDSDGLLVFKVMEGLGNATNNVAEYCSLILGLREALAKGVKRVRIQGDSKLVCLQVRGEWKLKHPDLIPLHSAVNNLRAQFKEFSIVNVPRKLNSAADSVANASIDLPQTTFAQEFCPKADFSNATAC